MFTPEVQHLQAEEEGRLASGPHYFWCVGEPDSGMQGLGKELVRGFSGKYGSGTLASVQQLEGGGEAETREEKNLERPRRDPHSYGGHPGLCFQSSQPPDHPPPTYASQGCLLGQGPVYKDCQGSLTGLPASVSPLIHPSYNCDCPDCHT